MTPSEVTALMSLVFQITSPNLNQSVPSESVERPISYNVNYSDPEFVGGKLHECYRNCGNESRTCYYTFILTQYTSMSYSCHDCPYKKEDCFLPPCITAGGYIRPVTVANKMLPGPSIQVCEGDKIHVTVINEFTSESTTIHWHGIHQVHSPFMDGVPFVTQCPVLPHNNFVYQFTASPAGTHLWHSHIGFQEADGLFGSLVVRKNNDPMKKYYDYDLAEHVMIIWHWYNVSTSFVLPTILHKYGSVYGHGFIINGLAAKVQFSSDNASTYTPTAVFNVTSGNKYRFRVIYNSPIYCPIQMSIDNHRLLAIASETGNFKPIMVDSFNLNGGERYDFVLDANQPPGNYWIKFRGEGDCNKNGVQIFDVAILHYNDDGVKNVQPNGTVLYADTDRPGVILNPLGNLELNYQNHSLIKVVDLNNTDSNEHEDISRTPDHIFYYEFSFNTYSSYFAPGPYPQINNISFEYPPIPLLTQYEELKDHMYCTEDDYRNKHCVDDFCKCILIYRVAKDSLVEMVFVDTADDRDQDHPMHSHGLAFYVVAMESMGKNVSLVEVKRRNEEGLIKKKFKNAMLKDNISVPAKGFVIIRFIATNPGYWLFHCHLANHMEMGMDFVLKIGEHEEMTQAPKDFSKCGHSK
ncbi:laccase-like [Chelonus insularis]|uniref:laccase-like n=1 Tax=Chelonus insularis TaxID=460826 RepID=UPI00158DAA5D|nr:laccase-like [Chelonus insularis]